MTRKKFYFDIDTRIPLVTDFALIAESGSDFSLLPIILFFVAMGLTFVVAAAAWISVLAFGNSANSIIMKFFAGAVPAAAANEMVLDAAVSTVEKFPFILSFFLIMLGGSCCGTLALCAGTFCHFVHLFNMYKDLIKNKVLGLVQQVVGNDDLFGRIHFQFTLAIMWVLMTLLNAPALMAWTQNVQVSILQNFFSYVTDRGTRCADKCYQSIICEERFPLECGQR